MQLTQVEVCKSKSVKKFRNSFIDSLRGNIEKLSNEEICRCHYLFLCMTTACDHFLILNAFILPSRKLIR